MTPTNARPSGSSASRNLEAQDMGTLLWVIVSILDIFAIYDVMSSKRDWATKVVLLAIILLIPFIGAGLYLFAFRDKRYS